MLPKHPANHARGLHADITLIERRNKTIESKRKEMGRSSPLNKSYEHKQNKQTKPKKRKEKEKK